MKARLILLAGCLLTFPAATATTTIDVVQKHGWSGNLGWTNWRDPAATGAAVGEYVCTGHVWSANCGWIHLGDGTPANGIRYSNAGSDFGVNVEPPHSAGGQSMAKLRGYAYGANIGWIRFEDIGNPMVSLLTGRLSGHAWSANCGWLSLGDAAWFVATTTLLPGADSDGDGIADAYEYEYTQPDSLTMLSAVGDFDGDGTPDVEEYEAGTDPVSSQSKLRTTVFRIVGGNSTLTWESVAGRTYRITSSTTMLPESWSVLLDGIVADGSTTSRAVAAAASAERFFRVEVYRPLVP
jgi:hypothetical protein